MANDRFTILKDNLPALKRAVRELTRRDVYVGVPNENAERQDPTDPVTNSQLGYIHEFGVPEKNIPPRPFLMPGVRNAKDEIVKHLKEAANRAIDGDMRGVEEEQNKTGLIAQGAVVEKISDGPFEPLKPSTIYRRQHRKPPRMGTQPLIDTGRLRSSITYVIRERSK